MPEEIAGLLSLLESSHNEIHGMRTYYCGKIGNQEVVIVLSRIGKVAASSTATTLIDRFKATKIIFTGVAGATAEHLKIGDIVIASSLLQHDLDASAIMNFEKFEVPLLNKIKFDCDTELVKYAVESAADYIRTHPNYSSAIVYQGLIASGDQFISSLEKTKSLHEEIPELLAVEMEGAAVGQICYEWNIPCTIIRTISDNANHNSVVDFPKFVKEFAAPFSAGIVVNLLNRM